MYGMEWKMFENIIYNSKAEMMKYEETCTSLRSKYEFVCMYEFLYKRLRYFSNRFKILENHSVYSQIISHDSKNCQQPKLNLEKWQYLKINLEKNNKIEIIFGSFFYFYNISLFLLFLNIILDIFI